jgi:YgiT-type zinc finger domain-containing protein
MEQKQQKSKTALRCKYCGCETNEDIIKAALWTNEGLIVIEDIPARLCEGCGEQFFEEEITQRIQQVITYPVSKAKRQIRAPVYSLSQVKVAKRQRLPEATSQQPPCFPAQARRGAPPEPICHQANQISERIGVKQDRQETLLCKYCESEIVKDMVKSAFWVDGGLLAVENVPARVCQRCRQQFYDDETAEKIATLGKGRFVSGTTRRDVWVPVFSLADVEESAGKSHHRAKRENPE